MLIVADVSNSGVSIGARSDDGSWLARVRASSCEKSADEWALLLRSLLAEFGVHVGDTDRVAMSSVVPSRTEVLRDALSRFLPRDGSEVLLVGPGVKTGVRIRTDTPGEVGGDLVCDAAAAIAAVGTPCVVVSFGVALAFSAIAGSGDFLGAAFAPGLAEAAETLRNRAAQLPDVRLAASERAIGRNTSESIRSGVMRGYAGLVARLVADIAGELSEDPRSVKCVATGDPIGRSLAPSGAWDLFDQWLTLEGLAIIADRNR